MSRASTSSYQLERKTWMAGTKPGHDEKYRCLLETALRLRPVVAFDDHEVALGMRAADRDQAGVFRRIVAGQRGLIILEFQHHVARPRRGFPGLVLAAAHQEPGAEFCKYRAVLGDVFLVAVHVVDVDARDPVALCHPAFSVCRCSAKRLPDFRDD